ncbi:MAG: sugar ABC transporter ATP-binding protein [Verrucomicrobiales bacterium]|nr:sugar ABC transporter ATP-binding protein [Verrucomicrobiales bacterium]|tara:strand:+ start:1557 stop:3059 length:1503 start_codon:yes stop_codon:yes gene_type:complete
MADALLALREIRKEFPGVVALDKVDFNLHAGEVHAVMGENGAGKSTLIKVITGVYPRDAGSMELDGKSLHPRSTLEAEAAGISTVYQEVNLVGTLSVAENILLGRQPRKFGIIRWDETRRLAEKALARLGLELDLSRQLDSCSMAIQQMVAIARALDINARVLILDEPTSSLDEQETAALFKVMRQLRDEGLAILFVTHFLDQVHEISDRITVLRNGALVGEYKTVELTRMQLIGKMLGREPEALQDKSTGSKWAAETRDEILRGEGIGRKGSVHPLDLSVRRGEVVGLGGLLGSGRTETARLLFGIDAPDSGRVQIDGQAKSLNHPRKAIANGLAFCSEDRKGEGIIPNLSLRENLILAMQASRGPVRLLPSAEQEQLCAHYIDALNIKTPNAATPICNLSGGNQQKVLLARWLAMQPRLIILDEPARGIDVGAKAEIEKLVRSLREKGMAVVFISSELEEVVHTCDRVAVMRDRRKVGELSGEEITEQRIMDLMAHHE